MFQGNRFFSFKSINYFQNFLVSLGNPALVKDACGHLRVRTMSLSCRRVSATPWIHFADTSAPPQEIVCSLFVNSYTSFSMRPNYFSYMTTHYSSHTIILLSFMSVIPNAFLYLLKKKKKYITLIIHIFNVKRTLRKMVLPKIKTIKIWIYDRSYFYIFTIFIITKLLQLSL